MSNFVNRWSKVIRELPMGEQPPPADSAAPGGDVEQRAREFLADEYSLVEDDRAAGRIRRGNALHDEKIALRAIIAALSAPKQVAKPWRPVEGCEDCAYNASLCDEHGAAPQPVEAEGRETVPADGEVLVTVSGLTGTGKSAVAGEIEIMCRALGLKVEHDNQEERNMTHGDWTQALEMYKPKIRIVEVNIPRAR